MAEALDGGARGRGIEPRNTFSRDAAPVSVVRRQIVRRQIVDQIVDRHVRRRQIVDTDRVTRSWTGT